MTETGMTIRSGQGRALRFTAWRALMLLEILNGGREESLETIARESSPLPMRILFGRAKDPE